jgi:membrane-associated phospholipid phosphatase
MKFIAKFLSIIFFPLFIPIYGTFLLFSLKVFSFYPPAYVRSAYIAIFMFGTIVPLLCILLLYKLKIVSDVILTNRQDRFLPYFCASISYVVCAFVLFRLAMPMFVYTLMIAVAAALFINGVVNHWWKISAHMTGIGGLFGGILCVGYQNYINPCGWIVAIILTGGMVAAARLYLNAHTPGQIVAGFLNGTLCTLIIPSLNFGIIPVIQFLI